MKTRPFSTLLVLLGAALLAVVATGGRALAETLSETKIRLMAEALHARDIGDTAAASKALDQLEALTPNDPAVQRVRAEVQTQAAAQKATLEQQRANEQAAAERAAAEAAAA